MGWRKCKLEELCIKITDGSHNPPRGIDENKYLMLSSKNVFDDRINLDNPRYLKKEDFESENKRTDVGPNDVLMTIVGTVGRVAVVSESLPKFTLQRSVAVLKPHVEKILPRFLMYSLRSILNELLGQSRGVAQKGIYLKTVRNIEISVPTIEEQKRILAILDEAFADIDKARALTEQNLKNARELFESYMQRIFSEVNRSENFTTLINLAENLDSKRRPVTKKDRKEGSYPYYGASGIVDYVDDFLFDDELLLISEDGANLLARTYPIAFTAKGKFWVNNHAHVLRFGDKHVHRFAEYYLNSISLEPFVSGMAQPKLNQKSLNSIPVPKVSSLKAELLVEKISCLEKMHKKLNALYKDKVLKLSQLKGALLKTAFEGRL